MIRIALLSLGLALLAPSASADKFYFGKKETAEKLQAGSPDVVEGVLLREENGIYVIRVEGGEIHVPKDSIYRIEKDDLTVAAIEQRERAARERLARADEERRRFLVAEASRRAEAVRPAEAAARREAGGERELRIVVDFQGLLPNYRFRAPYDPVLHRVNLGGLARVVEAYLREEIERAAHRRR